jgi:hypothetical protein
VHLFALNVAGFVPQLAASSSGAAYVSGDSGTGISAYMPIASASPQPKKKNNAVGVSLSPLLLTAVAAAVVGLAIGSRDD